MKRMGMAAVVLAVCLLFTACEAQMAGGGTRTGGNVVASGNTPNSGTGTSEAAEGKVLQSYMMQDAGGGTPQEGKVYLTLYTDGTFTYKIQMYDGYPTVDGTYEATDTGYLLKALTTTAQNIPVNKLGDIHMEREGDNLVYQGSQLNEIFSGAVFVPCIISEDA